MSEDTQLPPLTPDQLSAIRELRFVGTNLERSMAYGYTTDAALAARCPGSKSSTLRSRVPRVTEYEVRMVHPEAVALTIELQKDRPKLGTTL